MDIKDRELKIGARSVFVTSNSTANASVAFVIGHGASGDANGGNLPQIAQRIAATGATVFRYNAGGPLKSRTSTLEALMDSDEFEQVQKWILAGHSMGGRTACAVAVKRPETVAGVVLFSYPLHPPGKQSELRDADLTQLKCPVMIVRGTKDTFSTEPTFSETMKRMTTKSLKLETVDGGDHSLGTKTKIGQERFGAFMPAVESFVMNALELECSHQKLKSGAVEHEAETGSKRQASDVDQSESEAARKPSKGRGSAKRRRNS